MTLQAHVRTLGRGPGRSRSLSFDEAQDAMRLMLSAPIRMPLARS